MTLEEKLAEFIKTTIWQNRREGFSLSVSIMHIRKIVDIVASRGVTVPFYAIYPSIETLWGPVWVDNGERAAPDAVRATVRATSPLPVIEMTISFTEE